MIDLDFPAHFPSHRRNPRSGLFENRCVSESRVIPLEFHQLDRRYEHLRVRNRQRLRRLLASLAESGQQTPIVVVAVSGRPDCYRVIDGYKRVAALEQLGRDTVQAVIWPMSDAEALVLDRTMRFSEPESALEQGWLLSELEQRFGYSLDDLGRQFDHSPSWVSRRLALVELLPDTVQQQVRTGQIGAHVAMKYLAPVARANLDHCPRMAKAFASHRCSSRQAGALYAAWREASPAIQERILDSPELFLKAQQRVQPQPPAADELLRDLDLVSVVAWIGAEMEFALSQAVASGDAFEHRPSECGHCVQNFLADLDFRDLPGEAAGFELGADDTLPTADLRFYPAALVVPCGRLPGHAAVAADLGNMAIPNGWIPRRLRSGHCVLWRRYNHIQGLPIPFPQQIPCRRSIIGAVSQKARDLGIELIQEPG